MVASRAAAQPMSCMGADSTPASRRVLMSVVPRPVDAAATAARATVQLFAQTTAERLRELLGARPGELPDGTSRIAALHVGVSTRIVLRREGRAETRYLRDGEPRAGDALDSTYLARAIRFAADSSGPYPWPEAIRADSLTFDLWLTYPPVAADGTVTPIGAGFSVPAFSLLLPPSSPARLVSMPKLQYPVRPAGENAVAMVIMSYVVDSTGRVDPASIRDEWPSDRPRQRGEVGDHYRAFVRAARRALEAARYEPARIGRCAMQQRVEQRFEFRLSS